MRRLGAVLCLTSLVVGLLLTGLACNLAPAAPERLRLELSATPPLPPPSATPPPPPPPEVPRRAALLASQAQVSADRLMSDVRALADMGTRHVLSPPGQAGRGISAARDWLVAQFEGIRTAHSTPRKLIQVWTQPVRYTWREQPVAVENVVLMYQGSQPGAGVIVVGAHYDSISTPPFDGAAYAPGANDNASGVAVMLEVARLLADQPHRAALIFVAFAAEETGRQGSQAFVRDYLSAQPTPISVLGMINLDMLGSVFGQGGQRDWQTVRIFAAPPAESPSQQWARQAAFAISMYAPGIQPVLQSSEDRAGRWGDQMSFSAAGYPSLRLMQGVEDPTRQHSPRDSAEQIIPDYLARSAQAALAAVASLAGGLPAPREVTVDDAGQVRWVAAEGAAGYLVAVRTMDALAYQQVVVLPDGARQTLSLSELRLAVDIQYAALAVSAVDVNGQHGPFSAEVALSGLAAVRAPR
jgi:hypothetical protein